MQPLGINYNIKPLILLFFLFTSAFIAACSNGIEGNYYSEVQLFGQTSWTDYEFLTNGKVYIIASLTGTEEANYRVDKNRVIIEKGGGNIVLTKTEDGTLVGKAGLIDLKLIKIDKNLKTPSSKDLTKILENYYTSKNGVNKLVWEKVFAIKNLEKTSENIIDNTNCTINISFKIVSKVNSSDIESIISDSDLKNAFGQEYNSDKPKKFIESIKKSNKSSGENINDEVKLILSLNKSNDSWGILKIEDAKTKKEQHWKNYIP